MSELQALRSLAQAMGVRTRYIDGLGRRVTVSPDTLVRVCAAVGAPIAAVRDAPGALRAVRTRGRDGLLPPVLVAWSGTLTPLRVPAGYRASAELTLEDGGTVPFKRTRRGLEPSRPLAPGYHRLAMAAGRRNAECTVIAAPVHAWHRAGRHRSWGVGTQLAALRSARSRTLGDLRDLESLCRWVGRHGGDLVTVLPLGPTFNPAPPEPSPYSSLSRLFWSELILDLGDAHRPTPAAATLDVTRADAEVRAALAGHAAPDAAHVDDELRRYARFRGAQARLGRDWRAWPAAARAGALEDAHVDAAEERFHLVAQVLARRQLGGLRERLARDGIRLGLDLGVGTHPDGYDPWSRQSLFGEGMSVGAPPDLGFPSGQDWGFAPVLPDASRREGHRYLAASIGTQASVAGVLRVDHIMAWTRLYWIPHGFPLHAGTYVAYPAEELFAVLTLESHRHQCEIVGENLGTVPPEIHEALPRHRIWGMYLAEFAAGTGTTVRAPSPTEAAMIGTHDTPPFAGWLAGTDVAERIGHRLLAPEAEPQVRKDRARAAARLARRLRRRAEAPRAMLAALLEWLGRSPSPLVVPWLEDLWLETVGVNLPGTRSSERPNWQRPMARSLDEIFADAEIERSIKRLDAARHSRRRA